MQVFLIKVMEEGVLGDYHLEEELTNLFWGLRVRVCKIFVYTSHGQSLMLLFLLSFVFL